MITNLRNKKVGVALGGGAVLGAAHIGVLKALEEAEVKIEYISGTSIGSFVAAMYAFGVSLNEIEEVARNLSWLDITNISLSKFGLLSNKNLGVLIEEHIGHKKIEDANIPLAMIATDVSNGNRVLMRKGEVSKAVMASTSIPGIFNPVEIDGRILVDGCLVENVPVQAIQDLGAEFKIAVDLNPMYTYSKPKNIIEVLLNSFHYSIRQTVELQIEKSDVLIQPDLSVFDLSDMKQVELASL